MAILSRNSNIILVSAITVITLFVVVFVFLLDEIYDHQTDLFSFGPSNSLLFVGISIDTVPKYVALIAFMLFLEVLDLFQEEYIDPFIHTILNANDSSNRRDLNQYSWIELYCINHFSLGAHGLRKILNIVVITIQIPLAILIWLLKEIVRVYFIVKVTNNWMLTNDRSDEVSMKYNKRRRVRF